MSTPTPHDYDELLICLDIAASMAGDPRTRSTFTQAAAAIRSLHGDLAAAQEVERERCAKIVEQYSVEIDGIPGTSRSLKPLADIIRSGQ